MAACRVCSQQMRQAGTGRPPTYCGPMCKEAAKRWRLWADLARELRTQAGRCDDPELVRALLARAGDFDTAIAYQRRVAANGWAAAERQVNDLNAAVTAVADDDY